MSSQKPPRIATHILHWLVKDSLLEEVDGDLQEKFESSLKSKSPLRAKINYWYQVLNYLRPFALKGVSTISTSHMGVFKHNFLITYRSFLRHRSTFFINLVGLSSSLAATLLIYLWISDELKVDSFHSYDERLYQIMENYEEDGEIETDEATSPFLAEALRKEFPEVELAVSVQEDWFRQQPGIVQANNSVFKATEQYIDPSFFEVFSYELEIGNTSDPLPNPQSVLISDQLAAKLYGSSEKAMGEEIIWEQKGTSGSYLISGVFRHPPVSSTRQFDVLLSLDLRRSGNPQFNQWNNFNTNTYVVLKDGADVSEFNKKIAGYMNTKQDGEEITIFAQKYASRYLYGNYENGKPTAGRIKYVHLFGAIALLILSIACINFMNLTTAKVSNRLKEIGVKKAMGATRKVLMVQYYFESFLLSLSGFMVSILIVLLFLPSFNDVTGKELSLGFDWQIIGGFLAIALFTAALSGSYPALYLSSLKPIEVLKGKLTTIGDSWVRKGLVVFQFSVSILLILAVLIVSSQMSYVHSKNLGFDRSNIIQFEFKPNNQTSYEAFVNDLKTIPNVKDVAGFNHNLTGEYGTTSDLKWEGNLEGGVRFVTLEGGFDFVETMGIELSRGRSYSTEMDKNRNTIIFNESAIQKLGFEEPLGQVVELWGNKMEIIGVVKDFHFASLYEEVKPCMILANPLLSKTMVKFRGGSELETIQALERVYSKYKPGHNFEFEFLDDSYNQMYESENKVEVLAQNFAGLSIILSCLGLLGLTAFTIEKRSKEICIRKIMGANAFGLVYHLSLDFSKMVLIAMAIAIPLGAFFATQWLEGFAFSINLSPWYFVSAALLTLTIAWITIGFQSSKTMKINPAVGLRNE